jgi:TonB-dependent starch-binding outer membrane protein SusC
MSCSRENLRSRALGLVPALALAGLLASPGLLTAQDTGSVTGTVIDAVNRQPIAGAQVSVEGTQRGSLTEARGRFLILGVPAGTHTVRVTFLGYGTQEQQVTVAAGQTAQTAFELQISAVTLDEVVVTGMAGEVERRKVGTSMTSLSVSQVQEVMPLRDIGTALQARIPGVRSIGTTGGVGVGRSLTIRGTSSFGLDQRPVVYVDGLRIDGNKSEWGWMAGAACCDFDGGGGQDRLGDINPEEIERIEILKGAAAATLFGSEASAGVIQIFTKRGRSNSRPQFTLSTSTGFNRLRENIPTTLYPEFTGPQGFRAWDANKTLIENGLVNTVDLTAQGGGDDVTYFVSGGFGFEEGSIQPNWQKRGNLRMNLRWVASENWTFAVNTAYARNRLHTLQSGNNWMSLLGNAQLGSPLKATEEAPYGEPWVPVRNIKETDTFDDASRWTGGITATYAPTSWFSNKVTVGLDNVDEEKARTLPFGYFYTYVGTAGERNLGYRRAQNFTADYLGSMSFPLLEELDADLAFGAQGFWETTTTQMAVGRGYAGPGVNTVGGAALTFGAESFVETINIGFFAQNRFSYRDRLFTTVGVRVDGNSAFGVNYGLKTYPKVDMAYQVARGTLLPDFISNLKLRAAAGQAGKFPGAFDQFQTFTPTTVLDDVAGVTPSNPGNADLRPETTLELEGGFDAGLFNDRLGIVFTYYHAKTTDGLLGVTRPPSEGFSSSRLDNVGTILNTGWELTFNYTPINTQDLRWTLDLNLDGNKNEILSLGDQAVYVSFNKRVGGEIVRDSVLSLGGHRVGYPVRGLWGREITGWDPTRRVHTRSDFTIYQGPPLPTFTASLANTLTFGPFRVYGLVSTDRGAMFSNGDRPFAIRQLAGDELLSHFDFENRDARGNPTRTAAADSLINYFTLSGAADSRDEIRIREVSVSYTVPASLSGRVGLGRTLVTLSGQNLWWWDDSNAMDPAIQYVGGSSFTYSGFLAMPQARKFLLSIRTGFGG